MKPGELYLVNLDPTIGDEIKKTRPVVVLNGGDRKNLRLAIVVPVTAWQARWNDNPFFVILDPSPRNGLRKKSALDCFQLRALSHRRFIKKLGELEPEQLDSAKASTALILDVEPEHCL